MNVLEHNFPSDGIGLQTGMPWNIIVLISKHKNNDVKIKNKEKGNLCWDP